MNVGGCFSIVAFHSENRNEKGLNHKCSQLPNAFSIGRLLQQGGWDGPTLPGYRVIKTEINPDHVEA